MQTLRRHVVCICAVSCRRTFQRCTGFHTRLRRTLSHIKRLKITPKYSLHFFKNSGSTFCLSKQKHPNIPTRQIKFVSTFVYQTRRHSNEKVVICRSVPIRRETFAGDKLQLSHRSGTTTISHRRTASDNYESNRLGNNRRSRFCFHKRLPISLNRHKPCRLYDRCIRKSRYLPRKSNPFRCQLYPSKHILRISRVNDRTASPEYKKNRKRRFRRLY